MSEDRNEQLKRDGEQRQKEKGNPRFTEGQGSLVWKTRLRGQFMDSAMSEEHARRTKVRF